MMAQEFVFEIDLRDKTFDEAVDEVASSLAKSTCEIIEACGPMLEAIYEAENGHPWDEEPEAEPEAEEAKPTLASLRKEGDKLRQELVEDDTLTEENRSFLSGILDGAEAILDLAEYLGFGEDEELEEEPEEELDLEDIFPGLTMFDELVAEFETQDGGPESAEVTAWQPEPLPLVELHTAEALFDLIDEQDREVFLRASQEYATPNDVFANFRRLSASLNMTAEQVLLVYAQKHWDGIVSYITSGQTQRETLDSRLADMRVYLRLLDVMNVVRG